MFSKQNRLAKDRDVTTVYRAGRTFFNPYITVKYLRTPATVSRFTVVVSAKVAKQAVRRNRIKRVLREYAKAHLGQVKIGDYMLIVRPAAGRFTNTELLATIDLVFRKNYLLKD
jgi:ribonuclease P protein component